MNDSNHNGVIIGLLVAILFVLILSNEQLAAKINIALGPVVIIVIAAVALLWLLWAWTALVDWMEEHPWPAGLAMAAAVAAFIAWGTGLL
jgi:hypothetical protein